MLIEIEQRHHTFGIKRIFDTINKWGYRGYYLNIDKEKVMSISDFEVEKDQNKKHLYKRNFKKYVITLLSFLMEE
jgi:hypothetical protein